MTTIAGRMRVLAAVVGIALLATGCSSFAAPAPARTPTPRRLAVTPTPSATPELPQGVLATGTLVSRVGSTSGAVTISRDGDQLVAALSGFRTAASGALQFAIGWGPASLSCPLDSHTSTELGGQFSAATLAPWREPLRDAALFLTDDPSIVRSAVVYQVPLDPDGAAACLDQPVAVAELHWVTPRTHQGLTPTDRGSRPGAMGSVESVGGRLERYRTAAGDTVTSVAARFDVTTAELEWLNPEHGFDPLLAGTWLGLDPDRRGLSDG